jgi:histidine ammonia-lyase
MSGKFVIQNQWLSLQELEDILSGACLVELGDAAKHAIHSGRQYLERKMESSSKPIYGVNTGFGSLCNTVVPDEQLEQLQRNLVLSHACGMGIEVPNHLVRRMLLLKVLGLSHGYSGVRLETVQRLLDFYNLGVCPIVYEQGSLGASGDLAPLAHLVLPMIGEGEAIFKGKRWSGAALLEELSLSPLSLASKEGLALLNGTQFMSAYASNAIHESYKLWNNWLITAATSLDAFDGRIEPFQENVNRIRQQNGQMKTASEMRMLLEGSELAHREKQHVQDPYSFAVSHRFKELPGIH